VLGLAVAQPPEEIVAADAKQEQPGRMLLQQFWKPRQCLRAHLAGDPGAHHPPADEPLELRRIAFGFLRAAAVGQAVAEGKHHGVAGQRLEPGAFAAAGGERDHEHDEAQC
jgi:hypothetical protein